MKTRTLVAVGFALFLCSILTGMQPSRTKGTATVVRQETASFNSIQISEGIEVEFEYGQQLQVVSKNDEQAPNVKMMLDNKTLIITNLAPGEKAPVQLKVITPGLVSIERAPAPADKQLANVCKPCSPYTL
jgi:hypothetical protein